MAMPSDTYRDIMVRTIANYELVKAYSGQNGGFEVTQLMNSILAVVGYPQERVLKQRLKDLTVADGRKLGLPEIPIIASSPDYIPKNVAEQAEMIRNAIAQGRIGFFSDGHGGDIEFIQLKDQRGRGNNRQTREVDLPIQLFEAILYGFGNIAHALFAEAAEAK